MRRAGPALALLLLAFGGYVKGLPVIQGLPVDVTVLAAAAVAVVTTHRALSGQNRRPRGLMVLVTLWWAFLAGIPFGGWNAYAEPKVAKFFTLGLLCMAGAMYILQSDASRVLWLKLTVLLGLVMAVLVLVFPNQQAAETGRLAIEGSNTIGAGRGIGAAVVILLSTALGSRRHRGLMLIAAVCLAAVMIGSGSRGPVLAAVISALVVAGTSSRRGRIWRISLSGVVISAAAYLALKMDLVANRLTSTTDTSAEIRRGLWRESWALIGDHPFGIGWGQLYSHNGGRLLPSGIVQYPHNLILEVLSEAGWATGLILVAVLVLALKRQIACADGPAEMAMLGMMVFYLLSALVSGDVNDNRGVWVAVGAALILSRQGAGGGVPSVAEAAVAPHHTTLATSDIDTDDSALSVGRAN